MLARLAMDRLVGGGRHVEQEERRDVARFFLASLVEAAVGSLAHQARDASLDSAIDVDFLAVLESANHPIRRGADTLEVAAHAGQHLGVTDESVLEEIALVACQWNFAQPAP